MEVQYPEIGPLLRERRKYHGWTLEDVSRLTGLPISTISKIETGQMSPTYDKIIQISKGLNVEIADLFAATEKPEDIKHVMGRRSLSSGHDGVRISTDFYDYTFISNEIAHKQIIPIAVTVRAHSEAEMGDLIRIPGEQFMYVVKGQIRLITEFYEPADLSVDDTAYIDSTMGHGFYSLTAEDAVVIVNHASETPNLAQAIREIVRERILSGEEI